VWVMAPPPPPPPAATHAREMSPTGALRAR
jgi:hypothetical protein